MQSISYDNPSNGKYEVMINHGSGADNFPIGTILAYTGSLAAIPEGWHLCDGTDSTPNLTGRFLEGSDSPGSFIEPDLPNITGSAFDVTCYDVPITTGSFTRGRYIDYGLQSGPGGSLYILSELSIDASRCSPIYGNSGTVQPTAYTVYYIMKVK